MKTGKNERIKTREKALKSKRGWLCTLSSFECPDCTFLSGYDILSWKLDLFDHKKIQIDDPLA